MESWSSAFNNAKAAVTASSVSRSSTTSQGSGPAAYSGISPTRTRAWLRHSACTSCHATTITQFVRPSRLSKPPCRVSALKAAVWSASSIVAVGAPRFRNTRVTRSATLGHASSQVRHESRVWSRNSVTEGRLDLSSSDEAGSSLGWLGSTAVVARASRPRAGLCRSGQLAGHSPLRQTGWVRSVLRLLPIWVFWHSRRRGGPG